MDSAREPDRHAGTPVALKAAAPEPRDSATNNAHDWRRLVRVVQDLSMARSMSHITSIVRKAARQLSRADGATFVLRDGDQCFYVEEDAIAPLWKGRRFPMSQCVSGWVMLNRQPVVMDDIYADPRVPADAYRPTFVKSMAMVPIRTRAPLGAIGIYWANRHAATPDEVSLLAALAETTCVAIENVQLYEHLEARVAERTRALDAANRELETFSYSVSHDLRMPVTAIRGYAELLSEDFAGRLGEPARELVRGIETSVEHMELMIESLLTLSRLGRAELNRTTVSLKPIIMAITEELRRAEPFRKVQVLVEDDLAATGDPTLLRIVFQNLLSNAWKYSAARSEAHIRVGSLAGPPLTLYVQDDGIGFDMSRADRLFLPFQRLDSAAGIEGHGVGLATAQRAILRHGGHIWAESTPGQGTTFFFTLGAAPEPGAASGRIDN